MCLSFFAPASCLSVFLSLCLTVSLLSVRLFLLSCLPLSLFLCPSVLRAISVGTCCLFVCLSVCLSLLLLCLPVLRPASLWCASCVCTASFLLSLLSVVCLSRLSFLCPVFVTSTRVSACLLLSLCCVCPDAVVSLSLLLYLWSVCLCSLLCLSRPCLSLSLSLSPLFLSFSHSLFQVYVCLVLLFSFFSLSPSLSFLSFLLLFFSSVCFVSSFSLSVFVFLFCFCLVFVSVCLSFSLRVCPSLALCPWVSLTTSLFLLGSRRPCLSLNLSLLLCLWSVFLSSFRCA